MVGVVEVVFLLGSFVVSLLFDLVILTRPFVVLVLVGFVTRLVDLSWRVWEL